MKKFALLGFLISLSSACGLFVSTSQDSSIYVGNSVALIELEQSYEELSLYIHIDNSYYGIEQKFAWLIPLPVMPQFVNPSYSIFEGLAKISAPVYRRTNDYFDISCSPHEEFEEAPYGQDYYEILEYPNITPQTQDTLCADSIEVIVDWLNLHGLVLSSQSQNLIQEYITKGWKYFYLALFSSSQYGWCKVGCKLRFAGNEKILPINSARNNTFMSYYQENQINVYIYTISNHKQAYKLGKLLYANSLNQTELDNIYDNLPALGAQLENGDFITKLVISYKNPNESIEEDIVLQDAQDNEEYQELIEPYDEYWFFSIDPFFILLAVLLLKRKWKKDKIV